MAKVNSIQYLRAFAAIVVLAFHVCEGNGIDFRIGQIGVDIFFVISGFVMFITTSGRDMTPAQFMMKRLRRILPLYWIATFAVVAGFAVKPQFFYGVSVDAVSLVKSLLLMPYRDKIGNIMPVLGAGWTLNIEMLFYLMFALSLWQKHAGIRTITICAVIAGLVIAGMATGSSNPFVATYTNNIMLEFAYGIGLGWLYVKGAVTGRRLGTALLAAALACIVAWLWLRVDYMALRGIWLGLPSAALVAALLILEKDGRWRELRFLCLLGDASYSIYLLSAVPIAILTGLWLRLGFTGGWGEVLMIAPLGVASGVAAYQLIEKPVTAMLSLRISGQKHER